MAENKKSFILYCDLIHTVRKMPKGKQADLFMTILEYVNDENPKVNDLVVGVAFEPIKQQLKRDLNRWKGFREKQSEFGKKGGRPKKLKPDNEKDKKGSLLDKRVESLNVTVNVTDTVNVKENTTTLLRRELGWKEQFCMSKNLTIAQMDALIVEFCERLDLSDDKKPVSEMKKHFLNWYLKKPDRKIIPTSKFTNNEW